MKPENPTLFAGIKLLLLDVDGVLTDGGISYSGSETETKTFSVRDGLGIKMLMSAGLQVGIVTGRTSPALSRRCRELGITCLYDDVWDKGLTLAPIMTETGIESPRQVAFAGDDLPDIPLLKKVGLPIAVANAHPEVKKVAAVVTAAEGGRGAVREICENLLRAQGLWPQVLAAYL
jgi:3-deoxy-D-manno-octulosonate 8-phosphate phosphatase (KDO 8-P phosphatase)